MLRPCKTSLLNLRILEPVILSLEGVQREVNKSTAAMQWGEVHGTTEGMGRTQKPQDRINITSPGHSWKHINRLFGSLRNVPGSRYQYWMWPDLGKEI